MKTFLFFKLQNGGLYSVAAYRGHNKEWYASVPIAWYPEGVFDHLVQTKPAPVFIVCPRRFNQCSDMLQDFCGVTTPDLACPCACHDPNAPKEWGLQL